MQYQLKISGSHYDQIKNHLYPGDELEAVAIALCGRQQLEDGHNLLVHDVVLIPYSECKRERDFISWGTERILPLLEKVMKYDMALLKIHSHPGGYDKFSSLDDDSDNRLFTSVFGWADSNSPHASSVMLPDGKIFGRVFHANLETDPITKISVSGDIIHLWNYQIESLSDKEINKRTTQAFGDRTFGILCSLKVGVIGCSGTGSPIIEQLVRLGVGSIVLIDPDHLELKNLNRILNSKRSDTKETTFKVDMLKNAIESFDLGTKITVYPRNLYDDLECLKDLATCDIHFGCMDSVDGRDLINKLSTYYLIPLFDLGIKLEADGLGGISKIVGTVNYIQPGLSSLFSRGVYDAEDLKAAGLLRTQPEKFPELVKNSYIKNINVDRPAVISVNMMIASYAINELLNRIHPYKVDLASEYAQSTIDLTEGCFIHVPEKRLKEDSFLKSKIGLGDRKQFLDSVELSILKK